MLKSCCSAFLKIAQLKLYYATGPDDCYEGDGESYRGKVSESESGDECLYWNSHFLLNNGINPFSTYEDTEGLGPHNFCRSVSLFSFP